jgi:glutamine transport system substrate-binding protein
MVKKFVATVLASALIGGSACAATLNVGTEATFAPFEFMDEKTKEVTGFDMEIIEAVAKATGDKVRLHNMGFDGLIPSLQAGIIDVTVAAMTITPERQKRVDFTEPYYQSGLTILIRKADAAKYTDLKAFEGTRLALKSVRPVP